MYSQEIILTEDKTKTKAFYLRYLFTHDPDFRRNLPAIMEHPVYGKMFRQLPGDLRTYVMTGRTKRVRKQKNIRQRNNEVRSK